jgi:hypothetical protein
MTIAAANSQVKSYRPKAKAISTIDTTPMAAAMIALIHLRLHEGSRSRIS